LEVKVQRCVTPFCHRTPARQTDKETDYDRSITKDYRRNLWHTARLCSKPISGYIPGRTWFRVWLGWLGYSTLTSVGLRLPPEVRRHERGRPITDSRRHVTDWRAHLSRDTVGLQLTEIMFTTLYHTVASLAAGCWLIPTTNWRWIHRL